MVGSHLSPQADGAVSPALAQALTAVRELRDRLERLERSRREPLAIVGMACRFPGSADSPDALWSLLCEGVDTVTEVPADRWDTSAYQDWEGADPEHRGGHHAAFMANVDQFDSSFFGISPREAARMDPQQRLFLETAWEALEDAGETMPKLQGSRTGVFVAANSADYLQLQFRGGGDIDTHTAAGGANSMIPNRLSYLLDLRGPSFTVDSACSSALVALHLASQSLHAGECDTAVVGGTNVLLSGLTTQTFDMISALSPEGRCQTFDAHANGYVRGEGVAVVVLKRLSVAQDERCRIRAVVHGTAVNQDGLTNGLTAPNGLAQRAVIRQALRTAGIEPSQVTLIEAHGTGTPLGDPIEVEALSEVYGEPSSPGDVCALGSVKTNIGHLEAAAGMAGLLKAALSIEHKTIAPNLHYQTLNPHIDLAGTRLAVPVAERAWEVPDERRHAAVSSFGAGGTNAHVILGPAPERNTPAPVTLEAERSAGTAPVMITISGRTPAARQGMLGAYRDYLASSPAASQQLTDIAYTCSFRRTHHNYRAAVVADSHQQAADRITAWLASGDAPGVVTGQTADRVNRSTVFVFSGHGSQHAEMGRGLIASSPAFRDALAECDEAIQAICGQLVMPEILGAGDDLASSRMDVVQPALFAIAVALAAHWRSVGVTPAAVVGHSMGEVAAACVAGALTLPDAARIICLRSRLLEQRRDDGAMLVVGMSAEQAEEITSGERGNARIAVSNSPVSTVLTGDRGALGRIAADLASRNVFARELPMAGAGHSPHVDALRAEFLAGIGDITPRPARVPFISTVTGEEVSGADLGPDYWFRNLREPVRFWAAAQRLASCGHGVYIEISPHPLLLSAVEQALDEASRPGLVLPSARRGEPESQVILESIGNLYVNGLADSGAAGKADAGLVVSLPPYAWQRERHWFRNATGDQEARAVPKSARSQRALPTAGPVVSGPRAPRMERPAIYPAVLTAVANVLSTEESRLDPDAGFFALGMDSLLAAQVRRRLENELGCRLKAPVLFEHPTVRALSQYLSDMLTRDSLAEAESGPPDRPPADAPAADTGGTDGSSEEELLALLAAELGTPGATSAAGIGGNERMSETSHGSGAEDQVGDHR